MLETPRLMLEIPRLMLENSRIILEILTIKMLENSQKSWTLKKQKLKFTTLKLYFLKIKEFLSRHFFYNVAQISCSIFYCK